MGINISELLVEITGSYLMNWQSSYPSSTVMEKTLTSATVQSRIVFCRYKATVIVMVH